MLGSCAGLSLLYTIALKKKQTKSFPKGKIYSEKSLFTPKKETCIILNARQDVHFEANLSTSAEHIFQNFRKNCLEYEESVN